MGLFGWLRRKSNGEDERLSAWRQAWSVATAAPDPGTLASLSGQLDAFGLPEDDIEIEREMLHALDELLRLRAAVDSGALPLVDTRHRVIGADRCHFSAPVSMPDDEAQPSGRLLLTPTRAVFVGGARTMNVPWHAIGDILHNDRDVVLIRRDRQQLYRFRCNTFADALCGSFLSRRLAVPRAGSPQSSSRS